MDTLSSREPGGSLSPPAPWDPVYPALLWERVGRGCSAGFAPRTAERARSWSAGREPACIPGTKVAGEAVGAAGGPRSCPSLGTH